MNVKIVSVKVSLPMFRYWYLHIPTGKRELRDIEAFDRRDALERINRYNEQQPGVWQYWLVSA